MKRIILLLMLLSMAFLSGTGTAEEAPDTEVPEPVKAEKAKLTLFDIRYYFEHRELPQQFYQAPEDMMESLQEAGLYDRWNSYTAAYGFDQDYADGDFAVRDMMQDSGIRMLLLTMPDPESTLLCYRIYLCYDPETGTSAYYTAEFDKYDGFFEDGCLICGWKPDGTHQYYAEGRILPDRDDPEYEKALAEEAAAILNLMREQIEKDHPEPLIRLT